MRKFVKLGLTALALMFVFNAIAVRETRAQGILNEILKRMDEHQKALTSLQSSVTMDKYNVQIDTHDISEGSVMYLPIKGRDALVRIDWVRPVQETLSVVNKQYVLFRPRLGQALTGKVDDKSKNTKGTSALGFMNMSKQQLNANYAVKYLGQENVSGGAQTWHLELTPKTAQNYKSAELWVDGNGMPIQAKVIENNNDSTTVLLSNLQKRHD